MTQKQQQNSERAKYTADELYKLLPSVYRQRDAAAGSPLLGLLTVISEQVGILEDDISQLYENWFIETCDSWVIPYIGDLLGVKLPNSNVTITNTVNRRSFVANTISYRRRKGTLLVMENLARDITGWSANAVEFFQILETTQCLNHIRLNVGTTDLREMERLSFLNTTFDSIAHTVEVRNISSGKGLYNIPNIGIFLWRLEAFPVMNAPAFRKGDRRFCFNVVGYDTQLFNNPITESGVFQTTEEKNLPIPLTRPDLSNHMDNYYSNFYEDKSIGIETDIETGRRIRNSSEIVVCDLNKWDLPTWIPPQDKIAVDPVLGRIAFPSNENAPKDVHVNYYYGFSGEVGGGFYERPLSELQNAKYFKIAKKKGDFTSIQAAANNWNQATNPLAIFEIADSEVYNESISLSISLTSKLVIRAAQRMRPYVNPTETIQISALDSSPASTSPQSSVTFDGLLFGQEIIVTPGNLGYLDFSHCTLIPDQLKIEVNQGNDNLNVNLNHTISGGIESLPCKAVVTISDSIIDAGTLPQFPAVIIVPALSCYEVKVERSTILGLVDVTLINASNSIFTEQVTSNRRQVGCMRFCFVPYKSRTPRQYRCQPALQLAKYSSNISDTEKVSISLEISPKFTSTTYGDAGYAQLATDAPSEIFQGADDGNEMGVFSQLQQAIRLSNLKLSIDEYKRLGLETGLFFVT